MFLTPTKDVFATDSRRIQEVLRITVGMNTKKTTPRYIMAKLLTDREGNNETTDSRLSTENIPLSVTGRWNAIFKATKENKRQPAILHREKSFKKKKKAK